MPDTREKLRAWLNERWRGQKVCLICGSNNWGISDNPVEIREFNQGRLVIGGPVYPAVMVICNACGYTLFFNAIVTGVVPREAPQPQPAAPESPTSPASPEKQP